MVHPDMQLWRDRVQDFYPNLRRGHSYLPPVFMHRTQHRPDVVCGQDVWVTEPPSDQPGPPGALQDSAVRDDRALQKVLGCLQRLPDSEVMFVISQLQFGDYLSDPAYAAAASMLPRPGDPTRLMAQKKDEGDFDVLIIHRHYGVIPGEIKSVGDNFAQLGLTQQQQDAALLKKVRQAVGQLHKSRDVLEHLLPIYQARQPTVKPALMLPNISAAQLDSALAASRQLTEVSAHRVTCNL